MPRINVRDEFVDLCCDCWDNPNVCLIAELLYCTMNEVQNAIDVEVDGGYHPNYEIEEHVCDLCGDPLTIEDNVGEIKKNGSQTEDEEDNASGV